MSVALFFLLILSLYLSVCILAFSGRCTYNAVYLKRKGNRQVLTMSKIVFLCIQSG
jgi:hypothetical protein